MYLKALQKINNGLYKAIGARNIVIETQVYINKKRNEKDKVDEKEILTYDDEQPFVQ